MSSKNRQVAASEADKSGSAAKVNVFPDRIPQEVLDGILAHLRARDMCNLAASCKNLHEGVLPALYHHRTEPNRPSSMPRATDGSRSSSASRPFIRRRV
ncbi:uncharacterized protein PG986_005112 [Apiospora aurea]|uniref:F-box domain-containing protein n=1 Tax=Apiospora aurea TaxID=335848 RepID=A0ABR1QGN8_9PEZI